MNIIYPRLIEQFYHFFRAQGNEADKDETYKRMIESGMLTETGEPTRQVIKAGLISEYNRKHKRLIDFKREFSIFKDYPAKEFTRQGGIWCVSQSIIEDMTALLESEILDYGAVRQVEAYFEMRNYENPWHSVQEVKGAFHPLHTKYDDSFFQMVDGMVAVPQSVLADMAHRAENGELDMDVSKLKELANYMDWEG